MVRKSWRDPEGVTEQEKIVAEANMFCEYCCKEIPKDSKLCPKCGEAIEDQKNNLIDFQIVEAKKRISANPQDENSYIYLLNAYCMREYFDEAIKMFENPKSMDFHYSSNTLINMGIAYYHKGKFDKTIELCMRFKPIKPKINARASYWLGRAYEKKGEQQEAEKYLKQASEFANDQAQKKLREVEW
jgi:pentatricopeptide repeat protein